MYLIYPTCPYWRILECFRSFASINNAAMQCVPVFLLLFYGFLSKWNECISGSKNKCRGSFASYCQIPLPNDNTTFVYPPLMFAVSLSSFQKRTLLKFWSCRKITQKVCEKSRIKRYCTSSMHFLKTTSIKLIDEK